MGEDIDDATFARADRQRFRQKLTIELEVFARMLGESRFDFEHPMTGLEVELNLVGRDHNPAMRNADVLNAIANDDFQTELGQFNIEINGRRAASPARPSTSLRSSCARASTTPPRGRRRPAPTSL